jgi:hypothetical protein
VAPGRVRGEDPEGSVLVVFLTLLLAGFSLLSFCREAFLWFFCLHFLSGL